MLTTEEENRIYDYLSGELDEAGERAFDTWLEESDSHRKAFKIRSREFFRARWSSRWDSLGTEQSYTLLHQRLQGQKRRLYWFRYAAVFTLLLMTGIGLRLLTDTLAKPEYIATTDTPRRIHPDKPQLTLGNGKRILLSQDIGSLPSSAGVNITLTDSGHLNYNAVADTFSTTVQYNTLTVPRGCEFQLTLTDGSRVWLNAGSELKYPEKFPAGLREVYLSGEAYFEVSPDSSAPFKVHTTDMELKVLGTSFNIQAYENEKLTTTLITGKIAQYYPSLQQEIVLMPSSQSVYDAGRLTTGQADIREALAWKEGKIIARNQRLEDILHQLSRWYEFEAVYIRPELKDIRFHLHSDRYENIRMILDNLQATNGIQVRYEGKKIYISQ